MSKLNPTSTPPDNMTRVLVYSPLCSSNPCFDGLGIFDFAFYKDGMYKVGNDWYQPQVFVGWISIKQLKGELNLINEKKPSKTHMVIDTVYYEEEGNEVFAGSEFECYEWISGQGDFGYKVVPMTLEEIEYHNKFDK